MLRAQSSGPLQVLIQSFMWAEKLKDVEARAEAQAAADRFLSAMSAEPEVSLDDLFSATQGTVRRYCLPSANLIGLTTGRAVASYAEYVCSA